MALVIQESPRGQQRSADRSAVACMSRSSTRTTPRVGGPPIGVLPAMAAGVARSRSACVSQHPRWSASAPFSESLFQDMQNR